MDAEHSGAFLFSIKILPQQSVVDQSFPGRVVSEGVGRMVEGRTAACHKTDAFPMQIIIWAALYRKSRVVGFSGSRPAQYYEAVLNLNVEAH